MRDDIWAAVDGLLSDFAGAPREAIAFEIVWAALLIIARNQGDDAASEIAYRAADELATRNA